MMTTMIFIAQLELQWHSQCKQNQRNIDEHYQPLLLQTKLSLKLTLVVSDLATISSKVPDLNNVRMSR